jgi:hypothetical protein
MHKRIKQSITAAGKDVKPIVLPSSQTIAKPLVSRRFLVRMSNKKMSDVMYAILITKSKLTSSYGTGIYQYNRSQNSYNGCWVMCQIPEQALDTFSQLAGVELLAPENPSVNGG